MRFSMVWQAKCSNIQFVYFYLYFCIMYSTIRLTFNALFNIQLRIQHSTILFIFNSSFTIQLSIQQFQLSIQHST